MLTKSVPIIFAVYLYILFTKLGVIFVVIPLLILLMILIQKWLSAKVSSLTKQNFCLSDERGAIISELISGIKMVKFSCWEEILLSQIDSLRRKERQIIRSIRTLTALVYSLQIISSKISYFSILMLLWWNGENITMPEFFVIVNIVGGLEAPVGLLMRIIMMIDLAKVSSKRYSQIARIPPKKEIDNDQKIDHGSIVLESASVTWEDHEIQEIFEEHPPLSDPAPLLKNINLNIKPGEFVGIVGEIGSGKTSILLALMGELTFIEGRARKNGRVAYISQEAFLINDTLKNNIIFGNDYNDKLYKEVLELSELQHDIGLLPGGDLTEIGERGINLSGGQKQRISIARAVYSQSDILIIDDALSALDSDVGGRIMDRLLTNKLRHKTRVMSTHKLSLLSSFDRIIFMNKCTIEAIGTLAELRSNSLFQEFIKHVQELVERIDQESKKSKSEEKQTHNGKLTTNEIKHVGSISTSTFFIYFKSAGIMLFFFSIMVHVISEIFKIWMDYWLGSNLKEFFNIENEEQLTKYAYSVFIICMIASILLRSDLLGVSMSKASYYLSKKMLRNYTMRPILYFDTTSAGVIMNKCTKDVATVDSILPRTLYSSILNGTTLAVVFSLASLTNFPTVVLLVLFIWGSIEFFREYLKTALQLARMSKVSSSPVIGKLGELINGLVVIRQYSKVDFFLKRFFESSDLHNCVKFHEMAGELWLKIRLEYSVFLVVCISIVSITTLKCFEFIGAESTVKIAITINYLLSLGGVTGTFMFGVTETIKNFSAVERIQEEVEYSHHEDFGLKGIVDNSWPNTGSISFQNLQVRYRDDQPLVIKGLDLHIRSGEKVGILGRTGSGKSTLVLAILRLLEADGTHASIIIDGADIRQQGLHELRRKIVTIPQEPLILRGTLKTNLDPFEEFSINELIDCLKDLNIEEYFDLNLIDESLSRTIGIMSDLKDNTLLLTPQDEVCINKLTKSERLLEVKINSKGSNLSQGQRQLISIGRAILRKPKILLMDEATASIDEKSNLLIQSIIHKKFKETTILTITHRPDTLKTYDTIVYMKDGVILSKGPPSKMQQEFGNKLF